MARWHCFAISQEYCNNEFSFVVILKWCNLFPAQWAMRNSYTKLVEISISTLHLLNLQLLLITYKTFPMSNVKDMIFPEHHSLPFSLTEKEMQDPMNAIIDFCSSYRLAAVRDRIKGALAIIVRSESCFIRDYYQLFDVDLQKMIEANYMLSEKKFDNERSVEQFLGVFAHELNSKLAGAASALESIIASNEYSNFCNNPNMAFYFHSLEHIVANTTNALDNMIRTVKFRNGILDISVVKTAFQIHSFIDTCCVPFRLYQETTGKRLYIHNDINNDQQLITDGIKLGQVIHNLLDNAFQHSHPSSVIKVISYKQNGCINFSIENSGNIIPGKDIENIFDLYYQVQPGYTGSGIGLYLSKLYTEILGGRLEVISKEGKTRFTVCIPF